MKELLLAAAGHAGAASGTLYVEDVFSAYPYVGNGGPQTITNGIALASTGAYSVWTASDTYTPSWQYLAVDSSGNVYAIGAETNGAAAGIIVLAKFNASGVIQWQRNLQDTTGGNATGLSGPGGLAVDSSGNVLVGGYISDTANGVYYMFVKKYDTNGNAQWATKITPVSYTYNGMTGLSVDSSGNVYLGGYWYNGSVWSGYVAKLSSTGTMQWQRRLSQSYCRVYAMTGDTSGNTYVVGSCNTTVATQAYVALYDTNGVLQWQRKLSSPYANGFAIALDQSSNLYVGGYDTDTGSSGSYYSFVAKYSLSGVLQWETRLAPYSSSVYLTCDSTGNVHFFQNSGPPYHAVINSSGALLSATGITLSTSRIIADSAGNFLLAGSGGVIQKIRQDGSSNLGQATSVAVTASAGPSADVAGTLTDAADTNTTAVYSTLTDTAGTLTVAVANQATVVSTGGLVWVKTRANANDHGLMDTLRGTGNYLATDSAAAVVNTTAGVTSFNTNGFTVGTSSAFSYNGGALISWTFRRAPKFFDVVTYTGNGAASQVIPHALSIAPGMITTKRRDSTGDWAVWHRSATGDLYLDTTAVQTGSFTQITATSTTSFTVASNANVNGATYVAYLWAHDASATGIVQCGSYVPDGSNKATVTLGWEPQYVMQKVVSSASDWVIHDTARGSLNYSSYVILRADTSGVETTNTGIYVTANATGFVDNGLIAGQGATIVYLAIRRGPMRTPTVGTSVYNAIARTGTGAAASVTGVGFAPDLVIDKSRNTNGALPALFDRLRGSGNILVTSAQTELIDAGTVVSFDTNGVTLGADSTYNVINSGGNYINWFLRRAPGFFDIVCYRGTGANQTLAHNLGVAPGMMWVKDRSNGYNWLVYSAVLGNNNGLFLNSSSANTGANPSFWNTTTPTTTTFSLGTAVNVNASGDNYVAYLFGALPGVSSVGSYAGNGATQTINCGFAAGARFVLIKRTDTTGDWVVLDTVRGIVSGNDPYLALDTNAAEVTTFDLLTPQASGFGLTSSALVNANGGTFIYFAVA